MSRSRPWIMRTYAGHSTAAASNALYRKNLEKGQTGLSIAFDLPTQTGHDPDETIARGEVGKVGVPIAHLGDMARLMEGLPPASMNTSMTINATAVWLYALYVANAEAQGADIIALRGTTQNDIIKEYLSRGTYVFPPEPSMRLTADLIAHAVKHTPKWNPINICSYHLQEAGATPTQELAFSLATAIGVLDTVRARPGMDAGLFHRIVGRVSFFVNAGIRFVEELCKMRAFVSLWDRITKERYGVTDPKLRRFRYGIQVNSLGLTEQQPENNIVRIVLEMLAVTLSKDARARAVQLPAWNEALGLPRPWDQQWSLRAQQILAHETDLLEYDDLFTGSKVVEAATSRLEADAWSLAEAILEDGGVVRAIESGRLKSALVTSNAERLRRIEEGTLQVIGVNVYESSEPSPLVADLDDAILRVDPAVEAEAKAQLQAHKDARDSKAAQAAIDALKAAAASDQNLVPASITAAKAGVTTGEWAGALREVFGEYRAPTGVEGSIAQGDESIFAEIRLRLDALTKRLGRRPKMLVAKPGLDGHSNGAEQIAIAAMASGFDVVYDGIRLSPERIADSALEEGVHLVGLSVLSGSHLDLSGEVLKALRKRGVSAPVVVGGIIPDADARELKSLGIERVYTPKDYSTQAIFDDLVQLLETGAESA